MTNPLPFTPIADITYTINPVSQGVTGFNTGLIIGNSSVISPSTRVKIYPSLAAMVTDGFTTGSTEYLAAQAYFAAETQPQQVAIGRQASGESLLTAFQDCRAASNAWYMGYCPTAVDSDHLAIAAYTETLNGPFSQYILQTNDAAVLANTGGNLFATLKADAYNRTQGFYSTSNYLAASMLGYDCGALSLLPNSGFIEMFKKLSGQTPEDLTTTQVGLIEGNNGNLYLNREGNIGVETGQMFSGQWWDNVTYGDIMVSLIKKAAANLLYTTPKVTQTESGMASLKAVIERACQTMTDIGFLATGTWTGSNVLNISTGDTLNNGFAVLSDPIAGQSEATRTTRVSPNIYILGKTAGALQSLFINLSVQQ